jgi:hypothetical protein
VNARKRVGDSPTRGTGDAVMKLEDRSRNQGTKVRLTTFAGTCNLQQHTAQRSAHGYGESRGVGTYLPLPPRLGPGTAACTGTSRVP